MDFIRSTSLDEKVYLKEVFGGKTDKHLFNSHDGRYKLYYPYTVGERKVVIYFSDYQRYGKIGS